MSDDNEIQRIEDYINKRMTPQEAAAFEQRLAADKKLTAKFETHQLLMHGTKLAGRDELKDRLKGIQQQVEQREPKPRRLWLYLVGLLAGLLLLLFIYLAMNRQDQPAIIYANYFQPYNWQSGSRDRDAPVEILELSQSYKNENYQQALSLMQQLNDDQLSTQLLLVKGICQMEVGALAEARNSFSAVLAENDPRLKDQANWYIALSYIREGAVDKAKPYLEILGGEAGADKHLEALELLKELE